MRLHLLVVTAIAALPAYSASKSRVGGQPPGGFWEYNGDDITNAADWTGLSFPVPEKMESKGLRATALKRAKSILPDPNCPGGPSVLDSENDENVTELGKIPPSILAAAGKLDSFGRGCADKVFKNSKVGEYQVVLVDPKTKTPWLWHPKGFNGPNDPGGLERLPDDEAKAHPEITGDGYRFTKFRGRTTTSLMMGEDSYLTFDEAKTKFELQKRMGKVPKDMVLTPKMYEERKAQTIESDFHMVVHESFHAYSQGTIAKGADEWKTVRETDENAKNGVNNRYDTFPFEIEPRVDRRMLFETLRKAAQADGAEKERLLREAAYWREKYNESGDEHKRSAEDDVVEGTAKYFDFMAGIYAKYGCSLSPDELKKAIRQELQAFFAPMDRNGGLPSKSDLEAYNIGLLANILRAEQTPGDLSWQNDITNKGATPAEMLLRGVKPKTAKEDPAVRAGIKSLQDNDTQAFTPLMTGMRSHYDSKDYVMVQVPKPVASVPHKGYYKTEGVPGVMSVAAHQEFKNKAANVSLQQVTLMDISDTACGSGPNEETRFIMVPKSTISHVGAQTKFDFDDPEIQIHSVEHPQPVPHASGQGDYETQSSGGKEWLCLK